MTNNAASNNSSTSANWRWIKAKIEPHPQGTTPRAAGARPASRRRRRDLRKRTQLTVTYRGGPEASFLVCFEDRCWRYPGHWCLYDVMNHVSMTIAAT